MSVLTRTYPCVVCACVLCEHVCCVCVCVMCVHVLCMCDVCACVVCACVVCACDVCADENISLCCVCACVLCAHYYVRIENYKVLMEQILTCPKEMIGFTNETPSTTGIEMPALVYSAYRSRYG